MRQSGEGVAVIIPCLNEEKYIGRCLDSLLANDYQYHLLDIVVVDGMSGDGTRDIVQHYAARYSFIRMIDNPQQNKPAALNLGIQSTSADIVMRIDAHATYAPDYISKLVSGLDQYSADNIGGIRETHLGQSTWDKAVGVAISHPFAAGNAVYRTATAEQEPREVDTVFCGCYRRKVFHQIGYFNSRLIRTQDREFNARLTGQGGRIIMDPSARCTYYPRTGLRRYARWIFQSAFWAFYAKRYTKTRMLSWRNVVPALFVLWQLAAMAGAVAGVASWLVFVLPVAMYVLVAASLAIRESWRRQSMWMAPMLFLLFVVTHYCYGGGSMCGWLMSRIHRRHHETGPHPNSAARAA